MFDFSFYELVVFGIIALIVLGPEKLPQAVRTAGTYYAKFRRTVGTLRAEMEAELDLIETRQKMQEELAKIRQAEADMQKEMARLRGNMQKFEQQQSAQLNGTNASASDSTTTTPVNTNIADSTNTNSLANTSNTNQVSADTNGSNGTNTSTATTQDAVLSQHASHMVEPALTRPWENMWFLLSDYDKSYHLPSAPRLPNYTARPLLNRPILNPSVANKETPELNASSHSTMQTSSPAPSGNEGVS